MIAACRKFTVRKWEKVKVTFSFTMQQLQLIMFPS